MIWICEFFGKIMVGMGAEDCTFFHFSHQMTEETCSEQIIVRTLARYFQMSEDGSILYQLLPHRFIMGEPRFGYQFVEFHGSRHDGLAHTLQIVVHQLFLAELGRGVELSGNLRQGGQMEDEEAQVVVAEVSLKEIHLEGFFVGGPLIRS